MANRAFIEDGSTGIRETTLAEHNAMLGRIAYLYQQNPPVELSVVASNGNISPNMTDTRYKSGTAARDTSSPWTDVTNMPPESSTGEPELVVGVTYDKISQTKTTPTAFVNSDYQSLNIKPVWLQADGVLREMTYNHVLSYFIGPVVDAMVSTTQSGSQAGGSYYISTTSSVAGSTNLGTVFVDTVANLAGYLASNIGTAGTYQDVYTTTTYYLQRVDSSISTQGVGYRTPLVIDYTANRKNQPAGLRHMTYAEFDSLFEPLVQYAIHSAPGYRLDYNINGNGTRQGTQIANRQMIGVSGKYTTYKASPDDYRAQEFPNGTIVVRDPFDLNLERT
jgi:hypothetical protein